MLNVLQFLKEMAANQMNPDEINDILFLNNSKYNTGSHYGYRTNYLEQELTSFEEAFLICKYCKGIARQACLKDGNISCYVCMRNRQNVQPVDQSRKSIEMLKIKCPLLSGCEWKGIMSEAGTHLKECDTFRILCPLECGSVTKRCKMAKHMKEKCPLHEVKCQFCEITILYEELLDHEELCLYQPIKCDCTGEYRRNTLAKHIEVECPLAVVECPYAKYSCKIGSILRKDMLAHKKEFYIEHQDMVEEENFRLKNEIISLNTQMRFKRDMNYVELIVSEELLSRIETEIEGPVFNSGSSTFTCFINTGSILTIGICKARAISRDLNTTNFHLFLSSESDELDSYCEETSVVNNDVGRSVTVLFTLSKEIYTNYIQAETLYMKMYFE